MSDKNENSFKTASSVDLVQEVNGETLRKTVIEIVEPLLTDKLSDFMKEINVAIQTSVNEKFGHVARKTQSALVSVSEEEEAISYKCEKEAVTEGSTIGDLSLWRERADDELQSAKLTPLKNLNGMHTIFCVDTSDSMQEHDGWEQAKTFFTDYMTGIKEENIRKRKYYNTALVTFGKETKVQQRLTKDVKALEQKMDEIRIGGPTPLLAGLMLAKASATISNYRFAMVNYIPIPPRIIVVTDGKATSVDDTTKIGDERHEASTEVRQLIIEEISAITKEEIEIHFVYVGEPDIVFLHKLREISGGELLPYTSGRKMAKDIIFKCILKQDKDLLIRKEKKRKKEENHGEGNDAAHSKTDKEKRKKDYKDIEGTEKTHEEASLSSAMAVSVTRRAKMSKTLMELLSSMGGESDSDSSDNSDDSDKETYTNGGFLEFLRKEHGLPEMPRQFDLEEEHLDKLKQALEETSMFDELKSMTDLLRQVGQDFYKENPDMQKYAPIGSRVKRGRDWRWGNQDKGGPGTIIGHSYDGLRKHWCWVEWDADGEINAYRWNMNGKCDLALVEDERVPSEGQLLAVGSRVKPGNDFCGDKLHQAGIVIKLIDDSKVQVRWTDDGSREELSFGKDGTPKEIEAVFVKETKSKSDNSKNDALVVNKDKGSHAVTSEEPTEQNQLLPSSPKLLEIYEVYENTACLRWQMPADSMDVSASKFTVTYRETSNTTKKTDIEVTSALTCKLDDLKAGSEYVAEVKLVNGQGESLPIKSDPFTTMKTERDDSHYAEWKLTERDAARLTSALGQNWEILGPELGVGKIPLYHIKQDNQSSALRIFEMLLYWVMKGPDPTFGRFVNSLKKHPEVWVDRTVMEAMKDEFKLIEMRKK